MTDRTKTLSVHRLRRTARKKERAIQTSLDGMRVLGIGVKFDEDGWFRLPEVGAPKDLLPGWTQGVRVESAGPFQHAVVATEHRGR